MISIPNRSEYMIAQKMGNKWEIIMEEGNIKRYQPEQALAFMQGMITLGGQQNVMLLTCCDGELDIKTTVAWMDYNK